MKKIVYIFYLFVGFWVIACSTIRHLQPADADVVQANKYFPNTTLQELQQGYNLYTNSCSGCHRLYSPNEFNIQNWKSILPRMFIKSKITGNTQQLSITKYILPKAKF